MEFKQLEMFVALADERHVQRAAQRVSRTQPAVSMSMARLEAEVGAPLFLRRENFRLTRSGEVLYAYARQLLGLRAEAAAVVASRSHGTGRIASPP
ncbi:MAG: hypothetical protein JWO56_2165 [Acidobacteria bacterium]|nr:hypothetical protein [Acidobacteriota bacterium]